MFESWSDVLAGFATAAAVAYALVEIDRRRKKLRELIYVLEGDDAVFCRGLEELVESGILKHRVLAAKA